MRLTFVEGTLLAAAEAVVLDDDYADVDELLNAKVAYKV